MPPRFRLRRRPKTFALVLGGGGARGLAHIPVIEALDDLDLKPAAIVGCSIGGAIGAAYAAGMTGREMRRYALKLLHDRGEVLRRLIGARATGRSGPWTAGLANPMLLDALKLANAFIPEQVPDTFEELGIPLTVVASDLYGRGEQIFSSGLLRLGVAASMAVPGLIRPLDVDGRILVDGGAVNPLPFDRARGLGDIIVAVDASPGTTTLAPRTIPDPWDALFTTIQLMGQAIVAEKLKQGAPDIMIQPNVGAFRLLDFLAASAILRAGDAVRGEVKEKLSAIGLID